MAAAELHQPTVHVLVEDYQHHLPDCGGRHNFCVSGTSRLRFLANEAKMLRFFKVHIEPIVSQKRQAPLWIRESKPRMINNLRAVNPPKLLAKFVLYSLLARLSTVTLSDQVVLGVSDQRPEH